MERRYPYQVGRLANGVQVGVLTMPATQSVSIGVWARVGSRHEAAGQNGIAHFTEHLLFRGTARRTAAQITRAVEGVGGCINAFTSEDHTCYYAVARARHCGTLGAVLGDIYTASRFDPADVAREREVIREEILMARDQPALQAQELLAETAWPGHALGRPLTGTEASIGRLGAGQLRRFARASYRGDNTVITVAGNVPAVAAMRGVERWFGKVPAGGRADCGRYRERRSRRGDGVVVAVRPQETEQVHLALGFGTFGRLDRRRFALKLLSVILGENMSSRLFQELRDRRGYCYSVHSAILLLEETGLFSVAAGLDAARAGKAVRLVMREVGRVAAVAPGVKELRRAQEYTVGHTLMGLENTCNQSMWMGESLLSYGRVLDPDEIERRLFAVTPAEVAAVAGEVFARSRLRLAVVGPVGGEAEVRGWLG